MSLTRVAVVGAGGWWGRQHARVFAGRPDTELVAVVDSDPQRAKARADEHTTRAYTDIHAMLDETPDLVSTALPNEGHFAPTLQLIRAGVPLLVEKPLAFDLAEADQLLAEAKQRNLFFAIDFNHRYAEPFRRAKQAIVDGALGELTFATWRLGGEPNFGTHPHAQLIETQCHGFDMLEHLCGPIHSVMAQMTNKTHGHYTTAAIALEFADGAVGSLVGSYDSSYAYPRANYVEVNGTAGRLTVEDTVARFTLSRTGDETAQVWQAGYFNDPDRDFRGTLDRHVDDVLAALRAGRQPPVHARAGRRALELAIASITSFETGRRVPTVPPER